MDKREIKWAVKRADRYFGKGYNCAESIVRAANDIIDPDLVPNPRVATPFGHGAGTASETCGAFTGSLIVIGACLGRDSCRDSELHARRAARKYRKRFMKEFGATNCSTLLKKHKSQVNFAKCREMTARSAGILIEILHEFKEDR